MCVDCRSESSNMIEKSSTFSLSFILPPLGAFGLRVWWGQLALFEEPKTFVRVLGVGNRYHFKRFLFLLLFTFAKCLSHSCSSSNFPSPDVTQKQNSDFPWGWREFVVCLSLYPDPTRCYDCMSHEILCMPRTNLFYPADKF